MTFDLGSFLLGVWVVTITRACIDYAVYRWELRQLDRRQAWNGGA